MFCIFFSFIIIVEVEVGIIGGKIVKFEFYIIGLKSRNFNRWFRYILIFLSFK